VASICTHNEPWVIAVLGHELGVFAPGQKSRAAAIQVSHHLLLAHGMALQALRAEGATAKLGIVLNLSPTYPASNKPEDIAQARIDDGRSLRWFVDPLLRGEYPVDILEHLGADAPQVQPGDLAQIAQPLDWLGINNYSRHMAQASGPFDVKTGGLPLTEMGWEIYPQGLTDLLVRLHTDYSLPPTYITENGGAFPDPVTDGQVHDADRTHYLQTHMAAVAQAMRQGVPMAGYMVWSLMDNFEWSSGYAKRFGIVHVDYATQQRTLKDSAHWYRGLLAAWRANQGA
jgi:beta-glucosidase